jgi:outer membrane lipoprotein-sorting protein
MNGRRTALLALVAMIGAGTGQLSAQEAKKAPPSNPVGIGSTWNQTVSKEVTGEEYTKKQVELIQRVTVYFRELPDIKGSFVQTTSDSKRQRGKFYVKRPGRFRFDYSPPSRLVILSDGEQMAIQDYDLSTDDRIPLDQTPFRVLLRKDVDLLRDARILEVQEVDDVIVLTLQDKNPDNSGRIKLYLAKKPALELKEWTTTDQQGLDTRIELTEVIKGQDLDAGMFKPEPLAFKKLQ